MHTSSLRVKNSQDIKIVCNIRKYTRGIHMCSPFSFSRSLSLSNSCSVCVCISVCVIILKSIWSYFCVLDVPTILNTIHMKDICVDNSWIGNAGAVRGNWFKYDHAELDRTGEIRLVYMRPVSWIRTGTNRNKFIFFFFFHLKKIQIVPKAIKVHWSILNALMCE